LVCSWLLVSDRQSKKARQSFFAVEWLPQIQIGSGRPIGDYAPHGAFHRTRPFRIPEAVDKSLSRMPGSGLFVSHACAIQDLAVPAVIRVWATNSSDSIEPHFFMILRAFFSPASVTPRTVTREPPRLTPSS
jgi:hypothetical protein